MPFFFVLAEGNTVVPTSGENKELSLLLFNVILQGADCQLSFPLLLCLLQRTKTIRFFPQKLITFSVSNFTPKLCNSSHNLAEK